MSFDIYCGNVRWVAC